MGTRIPTPYFCKGQESESVSISESVPAMKMSHSLFYVDVQCFRTQLEVTSDPVVTNAMMFICKTMHDSVK